MRTGTVPSVQTPRLSILIRGARVVIAPSAAFHRTSTPALGIPFFHANTQLQRKGGRHRRDLPVLSGITSATSDSSAVTWKLADGTPGPIDLTRGPGTFRARCPASSGSRRFPWRRTRTRRIDHARIHAPHDGHAFSRDAVPRTRALNGMGGGARCTHVVHIDRNATSEKTGTGGDELSVGIAASEDERGGRGAQVEGSCSLNHLEGSLDDRGTGHRLELVYKPFHCENGRENIRRAAHSARLRLYVLGPVTVRHASDPPASTRVTQPRQLALLSYLVMARPRGTSCAGRAHRAAVAGTRRDARSPSPAQCPARLAAAAWSRRDHFGRERSGGDRSPRMITCDAMDLERDGRRPNDGGRRESSTSRSMDSTSQSAPDFDRGCLSNASD